MLANRFESTCYRCGTTVKAGEGLTHPVSDYHREIWEGVTLPRWLVQHIPCFKKYGGTTKHYLFDGEGEIIVIDEDDT